MASMQALEFYTDYRRYLSDFYQRKKKESPAFSYRKFCIRSGLKSPSIYREVMLGKRNLTPSTISAFIKGLGLSKRDGKFFENLVFFNQAKSEDAKKSHLSILRKLRRHRPQKLLPIHLFGYYEKWYNPIIRELAAALDWRGDYGLLANYVNPPISVPEAKESVRLLLRLGLLKKNSNGKYIQTDPNITTGPEIKSLAVKQMNRDYARLGMEASDRYPASERDISSVVMAVSRQDLPKLKREAADFRKRIIEIVDGGGDKADHFYLLVVELFPVGRPGSPQ